MPTDLCVLFAAAAAEVHRLYGDREQFAVVTVRTRSGLKLRLDVPCWWQPGGADSAPFVPNGFQAGILQALRGKALRTDALAAQVGNRRRLFVDPGGIKELRRHGLLRLHKRLGFYRPDAPPAELTPPCEGE